MATATQPARATGHYLTNGERLVYVLRIDDAGQAMVEDAVTGMLLYLAPDDAEWKPVRRG